MKNEKQTIMADNDDNNRKAYLLDSVSLTIKEVSLEEAEAGIKANATRVEIIPFKTEDITEWGIDYYKVISPIYTREVVQQGLTGFILSGSRDIANAVFAGSVYVIVDNKEDFRSATLMPFTVSHCEGENLTIQGLFPAEVLNMKEIVNIQY